MIRFLLLSLFSILSFSAFSQWHQMSAEVMTTRLELEFWSKDLSVAEKAKAGVLERFEQVDKMMSRHRSDSELSLVNDHSADRPVVVSEDLFSVLNKAISMSVLSDGAFDITFASVGRLYDYRKEVKPNSQQIVESLASIDYRHVILDKRKRSVSFSRPGVVLDLGGIAKGYAVDEGIDVLLALGIKNARLSAGGDMYLLGGKLNKPWIVAVRDPRDDSRNSVVLPLSDVALSTSGDYERYFIDEVGQRVHHIISPKTGKSANGLMSVSVLGPNVTTTDALSTAIFVLGLQKGLALVNRLEGVDAILIDSEQRIHYSEGLAKR